uniref:Uncharacterized protein n=1 Tax=Lepeophtheirus salmonis TaxID=72036 RepID=A0A0K2TVZ8_LEPSM
MPSTTTSIKYSYHTQLEVAVKNICYISKLQTVTPPWRSYIFISWLAPY